jgi:hypothetical protein
VRMAHRLLYRTIVQDLKPVQGMQGPCRAHPTCGTVLQDRTGSPAGFAKVLYQG